ncbi:MAG TPA: hypothetical protein VEU62_09625 [Bryobacterales bacterium]|nr:hypothetical protein [Bryobacterales bacterium]
MTSGLQLIPLALEAILAALVWLLYRRAGGARRDLLALETAQGLMKKRFEAATAGLHLRLLHVERQLRQAPPEIPSAGRVALRTVETHERSIVPPAVRPLAADPTHPRDRLSRGEMDLLRKVRQLTAAGSRP